MALALFQGLKTFCLISIHFLISTEPKQYVGIPLLTVWKKRNSFIRSTYVLWFGGQQHSNCYTLHINFMLYPNALKLKEYSKIVNWKTRFCIFFGRNIRILFNMFRYISFLFYNLFVFSAFFSICSSSAPFILLKFLFLLNNNKFILNKFLNSLNA